MINSWTELKQAVAYLEHLQWVFCVPEFLNKERQPDACHHDAERCPVVQYLTRERLTRESNPQAFQKFLDLSNVDAQKGREAWAISLYPRMEFCPYCGGYQDGVARLKNPEAPKSKLTVNPAGIKPEHRRYDYRFSGGYLCGIPEVSNGEVYRKMYACTESRCQASATWTCKPFYLKRYEPPEEIAVLIDDKCHCARYRVFDNLEKTIRQQLAKGSKDV